MPYRGARVCPLQHIGTDGEDQGEGYPPGKKQCFPYRWQFQLMYVKFSHISWMHKQINLKYHLSSIDFTSGSCQSWVGWVRIRVGILWGWAVCGCYFSDLNARNWHYNEATFSANSLSDLCLYFWRAYYTETLTSLSIFFSNRLPDFSNFLTIILAVDWFILRVRAACLKENPSLCTSLTSYTRVLRVIFAYFLS